MMKAVFDPAKRKRRGWAGLCFFLLIAGGWALTLYLLDGLSLALVDRRPFVHVVQQDFLNATPSLLYTLFIGTAYQFGAGLGGVAGGLWAFIAAQSLLAAALCARACSWLYAKGAPFFLVLAIALVLAALFPFSRVVVRPQPDALLVVLMFCLVLWLIESVGDNCERLRRPAPICALFGMLSLLSLIDPLMFPISVVTLVAASLTPTRIRARLLLLSLGLICLWLVVFCVLLPWLGWAESPFVLIPEALSPLPSFRTFNILVGFLVAALLVLIILVDTLCARRPRYLLPFIPLIGAGALLAFTRPAYAIDGLLTLSLFVFCLPFLALIPFMREYRETKDTMRKRFLALRAAIPPEERNARSDAACSLLVRKLMDRNPRKGYIGLYSAQGSELSLGLLAVQLSVLGYKMAYPTVTSDTEMEFCTTLGLSDDELFDAILEDSPFTTVTGSDFERLNRVDPAEIIALVVPAIIFDEDRYRVGYGGGYYDRYIKRLPKNTPVWGVAFKEQITRAVPVEPHDLSLTGIIVA